MSKRMLVLMCSIFLIVPLLFMGCGDDGAAGAKGDQGIPGIPGDNGAQGPAGPVTTTNESCMVCHASGKIMDVSDTATTGVHYVAADKYTTLAIDNIAVDNVGGYPVVTFRVRTGTTPVTTLDNTAFRFYAADLVPAGTVTAEGTWSTAQFERWAYETSAMLGFDNSLAASGNYKYTFDNVWGGDNTAVALDFNTTHVQRIFIRASLTGYSYGVGIVDFNIPAGGTPTTGLTTGSQRMFVTIETCQKCHSERMRGAAHGSAGNGYPDTRACVICHTPIGALYGEEMVDLEAWFGSLIHKLHSAKEVAGFPTRIGGQGYTAVTYPQEITNCVTCHTASAGDKGVGVDNLVNNWKDHPTRAYCGTCHTSVNFVTGVGHGPDEIGAVGGVQTTDTGCVVCHPPDGSGYGKSVTQAHDFSAASALHANAKNVPEYDVTLATTAYPSSGYFSAGDNVTFTVTLKTHSTGTAVAGTLYTTAKQAAGTAGGGLSTASLYFYGPRAMPKPLLTSPTTGLPLQATPMFVSTTNTSILTDTSGLKYKATIPDNLVAGTYMVRVRIADYGYISETDYQLESVAFQTIQIGQAAETNRVSGDACVDCHGTTVTAPFHDARHVVAWKTDECVSCHDYSGGHAATLSNRVHAVHSANSYGDMVNPLGEITDRAWSDVTYPQTAWSSSTGLVSSDGTRFCNTCHTSGNTSYRSTVGEVSCLGCHGDDPNPTTFTGGATNHMLQSGGHYPVAP